MTAQYPDIVDALRRATALAATNTTNATRVQSYILDAEIVAVDFTSGAILPFSTLMTRKKTVHGGSFAS
jgi:ATP-dependent DNA ligase